MLIAPTERRLTDSCLQFTQQGSSNMYSYAGGVFRFEKACAPTADYIAVLGMAGTWRHAGKQKQNQPGFHTTAQKIHREFNIYLNGALLLRFWGIRRGGPCPYSQATSLRLHKQPRFRFRMRVHRF